MTITTSALSAGLCEVQVRKQNKRGAISLLASSSMRWLRPLVVAVSASFAAQAEDLTPVVFGSVGGLSDAGIILADSLGFFEEEGIDLEHKRLANGPALLSAIATNQLQAAGISITPGLYSAVEQGIELRIVGDKHMVTGKSLTTSLVLSAASFNGATAAALPSMSGKSIAIASKASVVHLQLKDVLAENGQSVADVNVIEMSYPNMVAALVSGAIDGAVLIEPFFSEATRGNDQLFTPALVCGFMAARPCNAETDRRVSTVPLVYSEAFASDAAAQGFMNAYVRGVRAYNDAIHKDLDRQAMFEILAQATGTPVEVLLAGATPGLDGNQRVDIDYLNYVQDFFVEQGFVTTPVDVQSLIDMSFADAAVQSLGTYQY
jgi:NitT/TauT family transport system substrate-binding protein